MKEYLEYKEWWKVNVFPAGGYSMYLAHESEAAFEQHVNELGVYKLMETLCMFSGVADD